MRSCWIAALALIFSAGSSRPARAGCPCAYIPNQGDDTIRVLDLSTETVTSTIPLSAPPAGAAVNPAGTRLYVIQWYPDGLAVYNTSTNSLISTLTGLDVPGGIAIHPDGLRAYVSVTLDGGSGQGAVRVIDLSNNTIAGQPIVVGGYYPGGVAITPDGSRLFVANPNSGSVSVIDTALNSVVGVLTGMSAPQFVEVNPAGNRLFVSDTGANLVRTYSLPGLTPGTPVPVGTAPGTLAVNPAGTRLHVCSGNIPGRLNIVNTTDDTVIQTLTVGGRPSGIAFRPDGARAYVLNFDSSSNSISVINALNNTVATTLTVHNMPLSISKFIVSPPWAGSLSPLQAPVGGTGFTLTVNGFGFIAGSQVLWNGAARTTTFVNHMQLTAAIPASDLAAAGTATVTVNNPAPAGGASPTGLTFTICAGPPSPGNGLRLAKASPNIHLAWNAVAGASSYRVLACTAPISGNCTMTLIGTPTAASYDDPVLATGSSYRYAIEAVNTCTSTP